MYREHTLQVRRMYRGQALQLRGMYRDRHFEHFPFLSRPHEARGSVSTDRPLLGPKHLLNYIPLTCNVRPLYIPLFTGWISVLVSTDWHTDGQTKWYLDFWSCFFVAKKSLARVYAWPEFGTCFLIVFSVWCWYLPRRWFDLETGDKTRPVNDNSGILGDTCDICPLIHDRAWQYDNTRVTGEH